MAMKLQEREAEIHNARIKERYQQLLNAEAEQFAEHTEVRNESAYEVRASILAPERPVEQTPVFEQVPQVTEYMSTRSDSPIFTTEKFNAVSDMQTATPVAPVEIPAPMQAPVAAVAVETEAQYSLSRVAKIAMAAFASVVVVMLSAIGINSNVIQKNTVRLNALEERRAELIEQNTEIQRRIEDARSEETIRQYALEQGMIFPQD